jgi:hypothetical protein
MCRNIRKLRRPDGSPTEAELYHAALQFVRKISGYHAPSRVNRPAFDDAVGEVAVAARRMFDRLGGLAGTGSAHAPNASAPPPPPSIEDPDAPSRDAGH